MRLSCLLFISFLILNGLAPVPVTSDTIFSDPFFLDDSNIALLIFSVRDFYHDLTLEIDLKMGGPIDVRAYGTFFETLNTTGTHRLNFIAYEVYIFFVRTISTGVPNTTPNASGSYHLIDHGLLEDRPVKLERDDVETLVIIFSLLQATGIILLLIIPLLTISYIYYIFTKKR